MGTVGGAMTGRRRVQPRRVIWQRAPRKRKGRPASADLADVRHRHGCSLCSAVYEDLCPTPMTDGRCSACRGHTSPVWETNLRPQECCADARPATPVEEQAYRLGGENEWWLCPTCKRPHIYKPRKADQ